MPFTKPAYKQSMSQDDSIYKLLSRFGPIKSVVMAGTKVRSSTHTRMHACVLPLTHHIPQHTHTLRQQQQLKKGNAAKVVFEERAAAERAAQAYEFDQDMRVTIPQDKKYRYVCARFFLSRSLCRRLVRGCRWRSVLTHGRHLSFNSLFNRPQFDAGAVLGSRPTPTNTTSSSSATAFTFNINKIGGGSGSGAGAAHPPPAAAAAPVVNEGDVLARMRAAAAERKRKQEQAAAAADASGDADGGEGGANGLVDGGVVEGAAGEE